MATYRTPDVYIEEIPVFPPSVAEVESAIPAFIGYTQTARRLADDDLVLRPTKIYSLKEYEQYFGFAPAEEIDVTVSVQDDGAHAVSAFQVNGEDPDGGVQPSYLMWYALKLFFDNGGGKCYVVAVGTYEDEAAVRLESSEDGGGLRDGLDVLALEDEPTLIVIPDAVRLGRADYGALAAAVLTQCNALKDRFAVFDLYDGMSDINEPITVGDTTSPAVEVDRGLFGNNNLKYGAAYYPFLRTSLNLPTLADESNVTVTIPVAGGGDPRESSLGGLRTGETAIYNFVREELKRRFVIVPPSGAVVGAYAATDTNRGVWKAPANISLADVIEPVVRLDTPRQDSLNVDAGSGKSINAIRAFAGKGTLIWGARTLAGNDNEWRYVSVRRFFNMVEESVKKSTYWAVFEPNDANTWVKVRGMIENYLTQKWREGALAGATTRDAFFVRCGLGTTMNAQDILEGRMNVEIGMAVVRPAEFIILKFSHKLQTS